MHEPHTKPIAVAGCATLLSLAPASAHAAKIPIFLSDNPVMIAITVIIIVGYIIYRINASQKAEELEKAVAVANSAHEAGRYEEALPALKTIAESGSAAAMGMVGSYYLMAKGVPKDSVAAAGWFQRGANGDDAYSQRLLGMLHAEGDGVEQDHELAVSFFTRAANQGDAIAQALLGDACLAGRGMAKNDLQAFSWYQKSSLQGYGEAGFKLAQLYESGTGVTASLEEATRLYRQVAATGHAGAVQRLRELSGITEPLVPGAAHPSVPHVVYAENGWRPADGFTWNSDTQGDLAVRFALAGQPAPNHENCVYDNDGNIKPAPGFQWATDDAKSFAVKPA